MTEHSPTVSMQSCGYENDRTGVAAEERETTYPAMSDYHAHEFYEISLISSGEVTVLAPSVSIKTDKPCIALFAPHTPHFITCTHGVKYKRTNVAFTDDVMIKGVDEYTSLVSLFKMGGAIIQTEPEQINRLAHVVKAIRTECDTFRKRLLLFYLLSLISDIGGSRSERTIPPYISRALDYIRLHYRERINASELAWQLGIGRTTLMTSFKKHIGITLNSYITHHRILRATELLKNGESVARAAELCGFGDSSNMNRIFKREVGNSPLKYVRSHRDTTAETH